MGDASAVVGAEGDGGDDASDSSSDWGGWDGGGEAEGDAAELEAKTTATPERGDSRDDDDGSIESDSDVVVVKYFTPLMYLSVGEDAFTLPPGLARDVGRDAARALTGESRTHGVIGHYLAEITAHWALVPDYFALGANAEAVARVAATTRVEPVGVDASAKPRSAAVIIVDREMDLMTPSVSRDGWLERVLDDDSRDVDATERVASMLCPLSSDTAAVALNEALCAKTARDGAIFIQKLLREALRAESIDAPVIDAKQTGVVAAEDLETLTQALESDPNVALRRRALIQRAKLTASGLTSEKEMRANRQIIAVQRLTSAALEGGARAVCATTIEILKTLYSAGGTATGRVREALALILAAYVIACE